jgi:DNA polymerase V
MVTLQISNQPRNIYMSLEIPVISEAIPASLTSPVDDVVDLKIDLNRDLIQHPKSTYFAKVSGETMIDTGIYDGDLIIIDRSLTPKDGDIAVCVIDSEFTIKRIKIEANKCWLIPSDKKREPILVTEDNQFMIWGIVAHSIKSHIL